MRTVKNMIRKVLKAREQAIEEIENEGMGMDEFSEEDIVQMIYDKIEGKEE